jgi:hypothetical protein
LRACLPLAGSEACPVWQQIQSSQIIDQHWRNMGIG